MKAPCPHAIPWYLRASSKKPSGWWCKQIGRECRAEHPERCHFNAEPTLEGSGSGAGG